jgi:hypothetical protein
MVRAFGSEGVVEAPIVFGLDGGEFTRPLCNSFWGQRLATAGSPGLALQLLELSVNELEPELDDSCLGNRRNVTRAGGAVEAQVAVNRVFKTGITLDG